MYKLMVFLVFLQSLNVWSQSSDSAIQFKGGHKQLNKVIFNYLGNHNGLFDDAMLPDSVRKSNKYFTVLIKFNKDGFISDGLIVNAYNDSTILRIIAEAVLETNGNWINQAGADKWAVLPIEYIYIDNSMHKEKELLMKSEMYNAANKAGLVCLEKIIIKMYPTVH